MESFHAVKCNLCENKLAEAINLNNHKSRNPLEKNYRTGIGTGFNAHEMEEGSMQGGEGGNLGMH